MTTRRRYRRNHPALLIAALLVLVIALNAAAAHALAVLVIGGIIAAGAIVARRRGPQHPAGPPPPVAPGPAEPPELTRMRAERDQLAAQVADLGRQLAEARDSAHAAWDAAASVPPRPAPARDEDARARLLADPLSGTRPLGRE